MKQHVLHINSIAEVVHSDGDRVTGFSLRSFKAGRIYEDAQTYHNYILYILTGSVEISCNLYMHKTIKEGHMAFLPCGTAYRIVSLQPNSRILFFAFDTTYVRLDESLFNFFVKHAMEKPYMFNTLPVDQHMAKVIEIILMQMTGPKRITMTEVCKAWNTVIFTTFATFYKRKQLLEFMRPIMSPKVNFRSFVENNFLEAQGSVSRLTTLSGMPATTFSYNFRKEFGCSPKQWLHEQQKKRILELAKIKGIRPTDIAKAMQINVRRLAQITQQHLGCTPTEIIEKSKQEQDE